MDYSDRDITIPIIARCNLSCSFCMVKKILKKKDFSAWMISPLAFKKLILVLKNQRKVNKIILSGGEPTLHPNIIPILKIASSHHPVVQLQTNGILLADRNFAERITTYCKGFFLTVMAGNHRVHDSLVNVRGAFEKIQKCIKNLHRHGATVISNTVVTALNYMHLPATVQFLAKNNVKFMHLWLLLSAGDKKKISLIPQIKKMMPFLKETMDYTSSNKIDLVCKMFPFCIFDRIPNKILINNSLPTLVSPGGVITKNRISTKSRTQCRFFDSCKKSNLCWGLAPEYIKLFGEDEIHPI